MPLPPSVLTGTAVVTVDSTVDVHTAETLWALYGSSFASLQNKAAARQLLSRAEFELEVLDPRVTKYIARTDSGQIIGLCTLSNDLATVPWVSPDFYAARYPAQLARGAVFYCGVAMVHSDEARLTGAFAAMVSTFGRDIAAANGILAADMCRFNVDVVQLASAVTGMMKQAWGAANLVELDRQIYLAWEPANHSPGLPEQRGAGTVVGNGEWAGRQPCSRPRHYPGVPAADRGHGGPASGPARCRRGECPGRRPNGCGRPHVELGDAHRPAAGQRGHAHCVEGHQRRLPHHLGRGAVRRSPPGHDRGTVDSRLLGTRARLGRVDDRRSRVRTCLGGRPDPAAMGCQLRLLHLLRTARRRWAASVDDGAQPAGAEAGPRIRPQPFQLRCRGAARPCRGGGGAAADRHS